MRDMLLNGTKKYTFPIKTKSPLMKLLNMELQDFYIVVNFKARERSERYSEFSLSSVYGKII